MLIDEIKRENINALKTKDKEKRAVLSVVINRWMLLGYEKKAQGKEIEDNDTLAIIQKVSKELIEEKEGYQKVGNQERYEGILRQEEVLKSFLPKQMNEEEIRNEISSLEDKTVPSIMKFFKQNFNGKVDMGLVNRIAREYQ